MKAFLLLILLTLSAYAGGAQTEQQCRLIDRRARATGFYPLKELAAKLTAPYTKEEDKVRSIFVWITAHIGYDVERYKMPDTVRSKVYEPFSDTTIAKEDLWDHALATAALHYKVAICGGYAALFKRLCDEAGLQAVIVEGCARNYDDMGRGYRSNHAWNAVMIHNEWRLLDATWGAGSTKDDVSKFTRAFDPLYYLTAPEALILNHYPDQLKWTLMANPPTRKEFAENPYIDRNSIKMLQSFLPRKGVLERKVGDSTSFHIKTLVACKKIDIYETETKKWVSYVPVRAAPEPAGQIAVSTSPNRKAGKKQEEEDARIDAIVAYADAVPGDREDRAEPDTGTGDKALFFTEVGDQLRFVYPVRYKGVQVIEIYVNDERILAYRVHGQ